MSAQQAQFQLAPADVLVVTAIREERDAVKAVRTGALGDAWVAEVAPSTGLRIERRSFRAADGGELHVALICAEDMGGTQTAGVAGPVVMALRPRCLAMCGVLGGKPDDTEFGDVIFADQLFLHDSGKRKETGFEHATRPHKLDIRWVEKARDFAEDPGDALDWLKSPAWTEEQQQAWLLDQFARGRSAGSLGKLREECCPSYESFIGRLLAEGLVQPEVDPLTEAGKRYVAKERFKSPRWPGLDPPRRSLQVHVGPIASGNSVQGDSELWNELAVFARKALGVEMEAHAIGNTAELHQVELAVVMKGVMDHANKHKDDRYKVFAARGSAECLLAFLRRYLPTQVRPDYDDILSPGTAPLPEVPSPSQLLMPTYEVVKFYRPGRAAELAELDAWCSSGGEVRVRLIHGPGGYGKTRLAIEWTRELRERGWAAGFLRAGAAGDWFKRLIAVGKPTAVVIDYAESHAGLRSLLEPMIRYARAEGNRGRVRVLLLARAAGDWWSALIANDETLRAFLTEVAPRSLEPLADVPENRVEVFREAVNAFASLRKRSIPLGVPDEIEGPLFERALYLHMAALAVVDGLVFRAPNHAAEEGLMDAILDHEERFWDERQSQDDRGRRSHIEQVRQLMAAATLRGGFPTRDMAHAVAASVTGASHGRLVVLIHDIYRVSDHHGPIGAYVGPLEPDLLGERMVLRVFDRVDERPEDFVDRVFRDNDAVLNGFIVLGRVASGAGSRVRPWIDRLLAENLNERALLALEAAKAVGKQTAFSELGDALTEALQRGGEPRTAALMRSAGIPEHTVALRRLAVWVYSTLATSLYGVEGAEALGVRAGLLNNLGAVQDAVGQPEAALTSAEEAVRIYEMLAKVNPDAFEPGLAMSLNNLGNRQRAMGQREAALRSAEAAVRIRRSLAQRKPGEFRSALAMSINNLSAMQHELGQREAALESVSEAARIYKELARKNPEAFQPYLATSLNNLGNMQSGVGARKAALESVSEAARIYEELARKNPDAFQPGLATSLNSLGSMHSALGQRESALELAKESVRIRRELAERNPDAFQPDLATGLNNLGMLQSMSGNRKAAAESMESALSIYRQLAEVNPNAYLPDVAMSLNNLGSIQSDVGHHEAALKSAGEAVHIYRGLAKQNSEAHQPGLAMSLNNLSVIQGEAGLPEAAIEPAKEAVHIYRGLVRQSPDAFLPHLATSLGNLGNTQSAVRQWQTARESTQEAVRIQRELYEGNPDAFRPDLAKSLNNLGNIQSALGQGGIALELVKEAFELYWWLYEDHPGAFSRNMMKTLQHLLRRIEAIGASPDAKLRERMDILLTQGQSFDGDI